MYCLYRFKDKNDEIVYIGKSRNIKSRMRQHFTRDGNLTEKECYEVHTVEVAEVGNRIDMDIKELYLINQLSPKFNTSNVYGEKSSLELKFDLAWKPYYTRKEIIHLLKLRVTRDDRKLLGDKWIAAELREFVLFENKDSLLERYSSFMMENELILTPSQKAVLEYLLNNSKEFLGVSAVGKRQLADELGISRRTSIRSCSRLESLGIIGQSLLQRPTGGDGVCAIYFIPD